MVSTSLRRDDLGLPDLAVGIDPLGFFGGEGDHAVFVGDLDRLLLLDIEHLALLGRIDPFGFEGKIDHDTLALDGVAPLQLGGFQHAGALDFERAGVALGLDALGRDRLLLGDAGRLDRFARGDVGFLDGTVAGDLQRADALFLGDAARLRRLACGDAGDLEGLVALDLQLPGVLLGRDAIGGERPLAGDAGRLDRALRLDLGLLDGADLLDLQRAGALVGGDALDIDDQRLGDARLFGGFAGRDLGLVDGAGALDLAAPRLLFIGDAGVGDDAVLLDPSLLDRFARGDLGFLDGAHPLDLALADLAFGGNARRVDRALVGDPGLLDILAGQQLLLFDGAGALDLLLASLALGGDTGLRNRLLIGDPRALDGFARGNLGLLGLGLAQRAFAGDFGALERAAHLDIALLLQPRGLALALDVQCLTLGLQIAGADPDHRVLLDVVAQLAPRLDVLHQLGQAFGVEAVRGVEEFEVGLVEIGDGDGFEFKTVLGESLGRIGLDARDIVAAPFVHLFEGHFGCDRADRGNELAGQQRVELFRLHGAAAERCGGDRDGFAGGLDPDIEVGLDIDAHAIARDHGVLPRAHDAHRQHVHVDRRVIVNEGQHEGAAVDHHAFAEEAGPDERHLLGGAVVEPVDDVDANHDHDDRDDQPEDELADQDP